MSLRVPSVVRPKVTLSGGLVRIGQNDVEHQVEDVGIIPRRREFNGEFFQI